MTEGLSDLLFDSRAANLTTALGVLRRLVQIDQTTGDVHPLSEFDGLSGRAKVAALALAASAAAQLGKRDTDAFATNELVAWGGLAPGTVRREVATLTESRLLTKPSRGRYSVASYAVNRLADLVKKELESDR